MLRTSRLHLESRGPSVRLLDQNDGSCFQQLRGHNGRACALARVSDEKLASGGVDKTIKLWHAAEGQCYKTLRGHKGAVSTLLALNDGSSSAGSTLASGAAEHNPVPDLLLSGSHDGEIRGWDLRSGTCVDSLYPPTHKTTRPPLNGVAVSESVQCMARWQREQLVSGTWGGTVRLWDLPRSRCTVEFAGHNGTVWALLQSGRDTLCTAGSDGLVKLWDARVGGAGVPVGGFSTNRPPVGTLGSSMGGRAGGPLYSMVELGDGLLVTGGYDQTLKIWDRRMYRKLNQLSGHSGAVRCLATLEDGTLLSGATDCTVRFWEVDAGGRAEPQHLKTD